MKLFDWLFGKKKAKKIRVVDSEVDPIVGDIVNRVWTTGNAWVAYVDENDEVIFEEIVTNETREEKQNS